MLGRQTWQVIKSDHSALWVHHGDNIINSGTPSVLDARVLSRIRRTGLIRIVGSSLSPAACATPAIRMPIKAARCTFLNLLVLLHGIPLRMHNAAHAPACLYIRPARCLRSMLCLFALSRLTRTYLSFAV
jgi:hypothetical protein